MSELAEKITNFAGGSYAILIAALIIINLLQRILRNTDWRDLAAHLARLSYRAAHIFGLK